MYREKWKNDPLYNGSLKEEEDIVAKKTLYQQAETRQKARALLKKLVKESLQDTEARIVLAVQMCMDLYPKKG